MLAPRGEGEPPQAALGPQGRKANSPFGKDALGFLDSENTIRLRGGEGSRDAFFCACFLPF